MRRGIVVAGMLLAMGLAGTAEAQDSYQSDVQFDFLNIEDDTNQIETSTKTLGYRWYFQEVDGTTGPYELQPFLQRASWAEGNFAWFRDDDTPETDGSGLIFAGRIVIPDKPVGIDVSYLTLDADFGAGAGDQDFLSEFDIGAVIWMKDDNRFAIETNLAFGEFVNTDFTRFMVGARFIMPVQESELELAAHFLTVDYDGAVFQDVSGLELAARFFFNQAIFAGVALSSVEPDNADATSWAISGGYTLPQGIDLALSIGEGSVPGQALPYTPGILEDPTFGFRVGYRF